jgi:hypothetical protein
LDFREYFRGSTVFVSGAIEPSVMLTCELARREPNAGIVHIVRRSSSHAPRAAHPLSIFTGSSLL